MYIFPALFCTSVVVTTAVDVVVVVVIVVTKVIIIISTYRSVQWLHDSDPHDIDLGIGLSSPDLDSEGDGDALSNASYQPAQLGRLA